MKKRNKEYKRRGTEAPRESGNQQDFGRVMTLVRQFPSRGGPLLPVENSRWNQFVNMPQSEIHATSDGTSFQQCVNSIRGSLGSCETGTGRSVNEPCAEESHRIA